MKNRLKNIIILLVLILFLLMIKFIPVNCIFKHFTGIYCPACGMTRAFYSILNFNFIKAFEYNILAVPLFMFIFFSIIILIYEIFTNKFNYIPNLLRVLNKKHIIIIIITLLVLSFVVNNLKPSETFAYSFIYK